MGKFAFLIAVIAMTTIVVGLACMTIHATMRVSPKSCPTAIQTHQR